MSLPLHDQERLGNHSKRGAFDHLPLGVSQRPAAHQGLFLDADDDVLVGRAENGAPLRLISASSCWHPNSELSEPTAPFGCCVTPASTSVGPLESCSAATALACWPMHAAHI